MAERWCLRAGNPHAELMLERELGVSQFLAALLVRRGIEHPASAETFLRPRLSTGLRSPFLFRDMERAAHRLARAIEQREQVAIFGDYDVDGVSGTAVLHNFLRDLGCSPIVHIPDRHRDGYGLKVEALTALAAAGARLLITVDCGGASRQELAAARELGMDVIVCDHHQVSPEPLPALAVLNPVEKDCGFPFSGLCGAGVAFYLALGARSVLRGGSTSPLPDLRESLDLVALGTVADLVPLTEENRVLVTHGLRQLESGGRPGLAALRALAGLQRIDTAAVGFRITPRLNASGRIRQAHEAFALLTERDPQRALELAELVDRTNRERQAIEAEVLRQASELCASDPSFDARASLVYASDSWHAGVIGIVAARLAERFHRPTVLIAIDNDSALGRGSVRSVPGWNVYAALRHCAELLVNFGGHPMAAGLTIDAEQIPRFRERFDEAIRLQRDPDIVRTHWADLELPLDAIDDAAWEDVEKLEPFGIGNPEPVFFARGVRLRAPQAFGEENFRAFLEQGKRTWPAVAFRVPGEYLPLRESTVDIFYSLDRLSADNKTPARLRILRIRPARPNGPS